MYAVRVTYLTTGAGISVSSPANIPDFRSATGLFTQLKERFPQAGLSSGKDLFDARLFQVRMAPTFSYPKSESSTSLFYSMIAELKELADAAQPTFFHHMLKRLDKEGRLQRVYTQNIDGLEEKAGLTFGTGTSLDELSASKRKRAASQRDFKRSQSDSAVLSSMHTEPSMSKKPLFPRAIPLHGSLSSLSCMLCSHTMSLSAEKNEKAKEALAQLRAGQPVWCERCEAADNLRTEAGLRSRGIGRMKVDVVLYHGENDSAEQVGACVERDLLGLRDPNEPVVPETPAEARARERRESQASFSTMPAVKEEKDEEVGDLSMNAGDMGADDVLAGAFDDDGPADVVEKGSEPEPTVPPKPRRLKPMPPDLLIVAGTSLKVPGTKRIVREFAKACRARDQRRSASAKEAAPVRVVYLNYDFPSAASEWAGTFDMWIRGDVQQAALGLCEPRHTTTTHDPLVESMIGRHTWHPYACAYEEAQKTKGTEKRVRSRARGRSHTAATTTATTTTKPTTAPLRASNKLPMVSTKLSTAKTRRVLGKGTPKPEPHEGLPHHV